MSFRLALLAGSIFLAACAPPKTPLADTRDSPAAVAQAVIDAVTAGNSAALASLALSEQEFRDHVWPGSARRPTRAQSAVLVRVGRPAPEEWHQPGGHAGEVPRTAPVARRCPAWRGDVLSELHRASRQRVRGAHR